MCVHHCWDGGRNPGPIEKVGVTSKKGLVPGLTALLLQDIGWPRMMPKGSVSQVEQTKISITSWRETERGPTAVYIIGKATPAAKGKTRHLFSQLLAGSGSPKASRLHPASPRLIPPLG